MRKADMMIDTHPEPLADDDIPMLTELPAVPCVAMPASRAQTRYHALLREVGRDGGKSAGSGSRAALRRGLRWKLAVPGAALGILAVALALNFGPGQHGSPGSGQGGGGAALAASWTPIPTKATAAETDAAVQRCSTAPARVVLAEQRGEVTAILLASGTNREACIVGNVGDDLPPSVSLWSASAPNQDFGSRVLAVQGIPADFVVGQVASDVATATVTLSDGSVVTASVADGWAFAWWPSGATAKSVAEYAANGDVVTASDAG
jgi:hypothetical protein